jgi:8-oxo-dGTP pyrophosphatase MutT (NUDIX family)
LHSKGVHWGFPKGRASPNETPLESATRELKEETGLDIAELLSSNPIVERYQFRHRGEKVIKVVHYFPALVTGELKLQVEEVRDAKWYTFRQALDQLTFKEARYILKECMGLLEKKA